MRTSLGPACAAALLALSCSATGPEGPRPTAMEPGSGFAAFAVRVVIRGEGFLAKPSQEQSGGGSTVDARHRAWLGTTELADVVWIDVRTLEATVPAGLPIGPKQLVVENAFGRRGTLDAAYDVLPTPTAALETTLDAALPLVNAGQPVSVTLAVANTGGAAVRALVPSALSLGGDAAAGASVSGPTPASIDRLEPGATTSFTWSVTALAPGTLSLSARVLAVDDLSSAQLSSLDAGTAVTVQAPAQLSATVVASRTTVDVGQAVGVTLTVANGGAARADLTAVVPTVTGPTATCSAVTPAMPQAVSAGASLQLGWTCTASAAGTLALGANVTAVDGTSGAALSASPAQPATVTVQTPAALTATVGVQGNPTTVLVGAALTVNLTVQDGGQAGAVVTRVDPVVTPAGAATCGAASPAPPRNVAGLGATTFSWSCTPLVAGGLTLGASVGGTDANTGAALQAVAPGVTLSAQLPATLVATIAASRSTADVGQAVTATFTLFNGGTATANVSGVTRSVSGTATATCGAVSPSTASIPGGGSATFTWTCTASVHGTLVLSGTATGTDAVSGATLSATPATPATVVVQNPAALAVSSFASSASVAVTGQAVTLTLVLSNAGEAPADLVAVVPTATPSATASCTAATPAPPQRIAGGGSLQLTWSCTATAAGSYSLGATVSATDANTGQILAPPATPVTLSVQTPAALTVSAFTASRATADTGQAVNVTLTLANGGGTAATVTVVTPSIAPAATPGCTAASPAPPRSLAAGGTLTFTWTCTASATGSFQLGASVSGVAGLTNAPLSASAGPVALTVQTPASLGATLAVGTPDPLVLGHAVTVTLTVTNLGGATANVAAVTPSATGAAATCTAPAPAPPRSIAGGSSLAFSWTCTPTGVGALTLGGSASGTDANTLAAIQATAPTVPRTVVSGTTLAITAFTASRATADTGQVVSVTLTIANTGVNAGTIVSVGPTATPATATCTTPSPATPLSISGGSSATFTWSCTATAAGSYSLGAVLSATDAASQPVPLTPSSIPLTVQNPAVLAVSSFVSSAAVAVTGQAVTLTLVLSNAGEATANLASVLPSVSPSATASCTAATPAPPRTIAGGASLQLTWSCTATAAGSYSLGATVSATDANTGQTLAPAATPVTLTVQGPATLTVTTFTASRASADTGQAVTVTLTVGNGGGTSATVTAVTPSITPPATPGCTAAAPASPQNLPAGGSLTFTWTCTASAAGGYQLAAGVSGVAGLTNAPLSASAGPLALTVQTPALLSATLALGPPDPLVLGQAVAVTLTVTNLGGATANVTTVTPSATGAPATCTAPAPAPPRSIAGTTSLAFTWSCTPTGVGALTLGGSASGTDANTFAAIQATASTVTRTVGSGTALAVTAFAARGTADVGQSVSVTLTIANGGPNAGTITSVTPSVTPGGSASCTTASPATPVIISGGGNATFGWTCTATAAGAYALGVAASATDAAGQLVSLTPSALSLTVQTPALLAPATLAPSRTTADVGQAVTVTLVLTNSGGASATLSSVTPSVSPSATASCSAATPAPPRTIAGGGSLQLTWSCTATAAGSYALAATVSASDANTGADVSPAVTGASVTVQTPAALSGTLTASPSNIPPNTSIILTLPLLNTGQATARVTSLAPTLAPAGNGSCTAASPAASVSAPVDIAGGATVTFGWTCTTGSAAMHTLGATVTATDANTGAALVVNVATLQTASAPPAPAGATEVILIAVDPLGDGTADPVLGTSEGAVWVGPAADGETVAWIDPGGSTAQLLRKAGAGAAASSRGSLGRAPTPSSTSADLRTEPATGPALSTLAAIAGVVYAGDERGIGRSATVRDGEGARWIDVTPSSPAWAERTPVAGAPPAASARWHARDRAVAGIVAFDRCGGGPCLLAARNVAGRAGEPPVVAQLWRCEPRGGPGACNPADWSIVAPDADGVLTRLGEPSGEALTILAATPRWVYVGLDDGATGVRLYRAATAPRSAADLRGQRGCVAGAPRCEGLGGNAFGDRRVTRFLDAKVLTVRGVTSLWIVAGDGIGPARVYRVEE